MATKPAVAADAAAPDQDADTTLLDSQSAAVKRLIAKGKERGYITFDELNAVLPPDQNSSEQIEDVMAGCPKWASRWSRAKTARKAKRARSSPSSRKKPKTSRKNLRRQCRRGQPRPHR